MSSSHQQRSSPLATNIMQYRQDNEDIKQEVDRMYARILKSIESTSGAPIDATTTASPILPTTAQAYTPDPLRVNHFLAEGGASSSSNRLAPGHGGLFSSRRTPAAKLFDTPTAGSDGAFLLQPSGGGGGEYVYPSTPMTLDATNDSRIAAMRSILGSSGAATARGSAGATSHLFCRNTFGSGRKGMTDTAKKTDKGTPGPGSYHPYKHEDIVTDENETPFAIVTKNNEVLLFDSHKSRANSENRRPASAMHTPRSHSASGVISTNRPATAKKAKKGFSFGKADRTSVLSVEEASLHSSSRHSSSAVRPPGPGEYKPPSSFECVTKVGSTKGSFGRAKRDATDPKPTAPGPGSYAVETSHKASEGNRSFADRTKQRGFSSSSPRLPPLRSQSPGPGAYDSEEVANKLAASGTTGGHSFGKAHLETLKFASETGPGPGEYDVRTTDETGFRGPKGAIPAAGRDDAVWGGKEALLNPGPGPGAYNAELPKSEGVSFKFRYREKVEDAPGPGAYETQPTTQEGPKWSLYGRPVEKPREISPGPADYNTYDGVDGMAVAGGGGEGGGRGVPMSKAIREMHPDETRSLKEAFPGPGHYHTDAPRNEGGQGGIISGAAREDPVEVRRAREAALVPGPGTYDGDSQWVHETVRTATLDSTSPRFETQSAAHLPPGPGYYDAVSLDVVYQAGLSGTAPRAVIGGEKRSTSNLLQTQTGTNENVGPGSYASYQLENGKSVSIGLPLPQKQPEGTDVGPGSYNTEGAHQAILPRPPTTIFPTTSRIAPEKFEDNPGPGAYDEDTKTTMANAPRAVFPSAPRERLDEVRAAEEAAARGPGTYDPTYQDGDVEGGAVGKASRFADRERLLAMGAMVPGPGTYDRPEDTGGAGGGTFIATGPGHLSMGTTTLSPGPGAYDVQTAETLLEGKGPQYRFGTSAQRGEGDNKEDVPGPGAYSQNSAAVDAHIPGPAINSRPTQSREERGNAMLGPGTYDPSEVTKHPQLVTIGSAGRVFDQVMSKDVPGPGWYAADRQAIDIKAYEAFMSKSRRFVDPGDNERANIPGPGYYAAAEGGMGNNQHQAPTFALYANRPGLYDNGATDGPGPGAYYTPDALLKSAAITIHALDRFIAGDYATSGSGASNPGPGTYDIASTIGANTRNAPTLSSGAMNTDRSEAVLGKNQGSNGPGPGAYDPYSVMRKLAENSPTFSFGIAAKYGLPDPQMHFPGPGAYALLDSFAASKYAFSFGKDKRTPLHRDRELVPGPGTYDANADPSSAVPAPPSYSFGQANRHPEDPRGFVPGPGAYNVDLAMQQTQQNGGNMYSFGSAPQRTLLNEKDTDNHVPGPGAYNTGGGANAQGGPSYSFPGGPKYEKQVERAPGPGAYNSDLPPAGPFYSIAGKYETKVEESNVPGPGAYDQPTSTIAESSAAYSIGNAMRFPVEDPNVPGPGAYSVNLPSQGPYVTFGQAARTQGDAVNDAPGPGMYSVQYQKDGPVYSFPMAPTGRMEEDMASAYPGPGAYSTQPSWHAPAMAFTHAERFPEQQETTAPGPGQYLHAPMWNSGKAAGFTTAAPESERQLREAAGMPGPGQYTAQLPPQGPFYSMYGKYPEHQGANDFNPGPGAYDLSHRPDLPNGPSATIPRAERVDPDEASRAAVPGPGMYRLPGTLSPLGGKFATATKFVSAPQDAVPGPGAYLQPDTLGGPKWTFPTSERADGPTSDAPGPGMYDGGRGKDATLRRPADFTIPQANRQGIVDANAGSGIGPGQYNLGSAPHAGPAYSIPESHGAGGGGNGKGGDAPGPGQYFAPSLWNDGKGATIGGKWKDPSPADGNPGPGAYRTHDYDPYKRDLATMVDFSKGGERVLVSAVKTQSGGGGPSPGDYYTAGSFGNGRGVTIAQRLTQPYFEPTPGPPDYHTPNVQNPFFDPLSR